MAPKRKSNNTKQVNKKPKIATKDLTIDEVKQISESIVTKANYNDLTKLLDQYKIIQTTLKEEQNEELEQLGRQLTISLFKVFTKLMKNGLLTIKKSDDDKRIILLSWLIKKYDTFKDILTWFMNNRLSYKASLQLDCLDVYLKLIKLESIHNANDKYFPTTTYKILIETLLTSQGHDNTTENNNVEPEEENFIILEFLESFLQYYDLQFYFFQNLSEILNAWKSSKTPQQLNVVFSNFLIIIKNELLLIKHTDIKKLPTLINNPPSIIYKSSSFKNNYQLTINAILSFKLSINQYKSILSIMNKRILPLMINPSTLMDFLTDCYNLNDNLIVQILSLNSLYELMKLYNLEYPDFFKKLYSLLTPELLLSRYRSRFFRLCDLFLSSTHLSANLVASFIKKLSVLSIGSSASGTIIAIPFIYNLIKRHPTCMIMIHNPQQAHNKDYVDPYNDKELDPLKTNAINSSLWELEALMNHYHPNISTLSSIFKEPFKKPNYNLEDFLDWSYKSLLDSEINKKYRGMAALEYETWDSLFEPCHDVNDNNDPDLGAKIYLEGWSV